MPFKINISDNGKTWKVEKDVESLVGSSIGDKFNGEDLGKEFEGYELEIRGGTDFAGLPLSKDADGVGLKRVLLKRGWGMKDSRRGVRIRKTVRGKVISEKTMQINVAVIKQGSKKLEEIFPEQNKPKEKNKKPETKQ